MTNTSISKPELWLLVDGYILKVVNHTTLLVNY